MSYLEKLTKQRQNYIQYEKQSFEQQIEDLRATLKINKEIIADLLQYTPELSSEIVFRMERLSQKLMDDLYESREETRRQSGENFIQYQVHCQELSEKDDEIF